MEIRMDLEASRSLAGSPGVDAIDLSELLRQAEKAVDAHELFLRDVEYPARFVVLGDSSWKVELRARPLSAARYREVDGEGPTPELAVANLTEGLDHLAEEWK